MAPLLVAISFAVALIGFQAGAAGAARAAGCEGSDRPVSQIGERAAEQAIRCLFNRHRGGRETLRYDRHLAAAAARHNRHMVEHGCFSHRCGGEQSSEGRIRRAGYLSGADRWGVGEVIATTGRHGTAHDVVRMWMHSTPHRRVILNRAFEHVGIAVTRGTPQPGGGITYTANFGYRSG